MTDLISRLQSMGTDKDFAALGLDFASLFSGALRTADTASHRAADSHEPYEGYEWLTKKVPRFGTVINAVPPDERMKELPWEEWFVLEGELHHHVLYLGPPEHFDEIFAAPPADAIHPPRTFGKRWYVIEDPDMTPVLLRSER
jgi:hypothetical protein